MEKSKNSVNASGSEVAKTFEQVLEETRLKIKKLQETKQLDELDANVLVDPWTSQDPLAITGYIEPDAKCKYGQMLAWRNPRLRNKSANIGWMGWIPLEYGDPYTGENGEFLSKYLKEIPARLEGTAQLDNYVRRGDAVLCRLPVEVWQKRQIDREAKYLSVRNQLKLPTETPNRSVTAIDGVFEDQKPGHRIGEIGGFSKVENEIGTEAGHRIRAERSAAGKGD